ncbi:MAG: hypothetical protein JRG74_13035 [Deltaproteobacteria bacterium]|nr:hypothetical protein [Deltaproteobacteria bacterium]
MGWYPISILSPPTGIPPLSQHFKTTFTSSPVHNFTDHLAADIRAESFDIGDAKGTGNMPQRIFDKKAYRLRSRIQVSVNSILIIHVV